MCWSETVSWSTFIIGTIINIGVVIWLPVPVIIALAFFWQWVLFVQFFEALAWRNKKSGKKNKVATNGVLLITMSQPILLGFILLILSSYLSGQGINDGITFEAKAVVIIALFLYILWAFYSLNNSKKYNHLDTSDKCEHLVYTWWEDFTWKAFPYLITAFLVLALLLRPASLAVFVILFLIFTLVLTSIIYPGNMGSMWCWFSAISPLVVGLFYYFVFVKSNREEPDILDYYWDKIMTSMQLKSN
jgi:hypothetical protein